MRIWVTGAGGVGPEGVGIPALDGGTLGREPRRVPGDLPLKDGFPRMAMRWMDKASLWWVNAVRQALAPEARGPESAAQVVGVQWGPTTPTVDLETAIGREGFGAMNPAVFPYTVGNAPAGQASILFGLRGPSMAASAGEASGLAALVEASRLLASGAAQTAVAGGSDALDPILEKILRHLRGPGAPPLGEGAYALRLEASEVAPSPALAEVAGWASASSPCEAHRFPAPAGPLLDRLAGAVLAQAGWAREEVEAAALSEDTRALAAAGSEWVAANLPAARALCFQRALGACGASWAGAAASAAARRFGGGASKVLLVGLSAGGGGYALALERRRA